MRQRYTPAKYYSWPFRRRSEFSRQISNSEILHLLQYGGVIKTKHKHGKQTFCVVWLINILSIKQVSENPTCVCGLYKHKTSKTPPLAFCLFLRNNLSRLISDMRNVQVPRSVETARLTKESSATAPRGVWLVYPCATTCAIWKSGRLRT